MGRTLALVADRVDAAAHPAEVAESEVVSPGLRRLVLCSPDFVGLTIEPCDVTAFRVSRHDFRHYTPSVLDGDALTIMVQRHAHPGPTPGHDLVEGWSVGDPVRVCRWSSARAFTWPEPGRRPVVLLGDATVLSLARCAADRAGQEGRDLLTVLEVPAADVGAARAFVPDATILPAAAVPGRAVEAWLAANAEALRLLASPLALLAGHGPSIQRQRSVLRDVVGLDRRSVRTQPYWAEGKAGL